MQVLSEQLHPALAELALPAQRVPRSQRLSPLSHLHVAFDRRDADPERSGGHLFGHPAPKDGID
jgi:hypothetical protein